MRKAVAVLILVLAASSQAATLQLTPITWDVVGLDSNNVNAGPNLYLVGVRVTNTSATAATNVVGTFAWDDGLDLFTGNSYINLQPNSLSTITASSIAPGAFTDFYFNVLITRDSNAYDKTRLYHVTVTQTGGATVVTPQPRQIYVEHLISQNRNGVDSITGPSTVYVGGTYQYTVVYHTATQGYDQLEAFAGFQNNPFQILSVQTSYASPPGATNDKVYADAGGWDPDPTSPSYKSIIGPSNYTGGKAGGGPIVSVYTIKVNSLAPGNNPIVVSNTINDHSGSSYHYNSDFGSGGASITVTVLQAPANFSVQQSVTGTQNVGSNVTFTVTLTDTDATTDGTNIKVSDVLTSGLQFVSATPATGTFDSTTGTWTVPSLAHGGASTTLQIVATILTTGTSKSTATYVSSDQTDSNAADNSAVSSVGPAVPSGALSLVSTSEASTSGPNVTIGEIARYRVVYVLPKSATPPLTTNNVQFVDTLPAGVTYQGNPKAAFVSTITGNNYTVDMATAGETFTFLNSTTLTGSTSSKVDSKQITNGKTVTVLVKDQATTSQNGVYVTSDSANTLTRVSTTPFTYAPQNGDVIFVNNVNNGQAGATNNGKYFKQQAANPITDGTTNQTFASTTGAQGITSSVAAIAGAGLQVNGDETTVNTITPTFAFPAAQVSTVGQVTTFSFGNLTNPDGGTDKEFVVLEFDALVNNVSTNVAGTTLLNKCAVSVNGSTASPGLPDTTSTLQHTLTVLEPSLPQANATKSISSTQIGLNGTVTYTLNYVFASGTNNTTAFDVLIADTLPVGLTPSPAFPGGMTITTTGVTGLTNSSTANSLSISATSVAPGGTIQIVYSCKVASTSTDTTTLTYTSLPGTNGTGSVTPGASGSATGERNGTTAPLTLNTYSVTNSTTCTVVPAADLKVVTTVSTAQPNLGANVTFHVVLTNNGPDTATVAVQPITVSNVLPSGLTFVSATPSTGSVSTTGNTTTWTISSALASGASVTLDVVGTVVSTQTQIDTAQVTHSDVFDPVTNNNTAHCSETPVEAELAVTDSVSPVSPTVGANVTYTITLIDNGPNNGSNVTVSVPLPSWLNGPTVTPIAGTTYSAGVWTIPAVSVSSILLPGNTPTNVQTLTISGTLNTATTNTHTVTITHSDQYDSVSSNNTASVTIPLLPPVAVSDSYTVIKNTTLAEASPAILGNDTLYGATITSYGKSTGLEQTTLNSATATAQAGSVTVYADGAFSYTPPNGFTGTDTFKYVLTNAAGTSTATVTLTVVASLSPPAAVADTYSTAANTALTVAAATSPFGVLHNDTLNSGAIVSFGVNGNEQTTLGSTASTSSSGSIKLNSDGSFTYTPATGFSGADTFRYVVSNAAGSSTALVTITVTPVASNDSYTTTVGTALSVAAASGVLSNDTGTGLVKNNVVTNVANGSLTLNADGSFTYTPNAGFSGTDSFVYNDKDSNGSTSNNATATITINPKAFDDTYSATAGSALTVNAASGVLNNDKGTSLSINSLVSNVSHGTLGLNSDGSFTYTPNSGFSGTDTFTYNVKDSSGNTSNTATATITVSPKANDDSYSGSLNTTLTINAAAGVLANDLGTGLAANTTLVAGPASGGVTLNSDGSFSYTPNTGFTGTDTFKYNVKDSSNNTSNTATVTITITNTSAPDLVIAKSHTGNFTQGDSADTYTITVTNSGTAATAGTVTVTDTLPAGLTPTAASGTGWSTSISGQTVTATRSDVLSTGSSYPSLTVTVSVANNAAASITNTASVSGGGETNTANDSASDATTIIQLPDLTIAKSHTGNFTQGDSGDTYSITVTNAGSAATSGTVTVTDTLPAGLTPTAAAGTGWATSISGQTVTATRSDALNNGSSYPALTVTVNVANNAVASITNTATVSGGGEVNTSNDSASDATTINQLPDLTIAKSHTGNFTQGDTADTYSITVSNSGSAATSGTVTVTDTLPAGLTPTAAAGSGWATSISGQTVTATRSDALNNGSSYPALTVTVNVANNAAASVTNTATVSGGGEVNTANDSASDATTINQLPDLTIAKSHSGNFTQGDSGDTYSITVSNAGSAATSGTVTVTDTLPAGLTPTAAAGTGWATSISGQTVTATRSDALSNGSSYPALTVTVNVANNATNVTNTATVSGGGEVNTANDSASDATTVVPLPDLTIAKSHPGNFTQGDSADTYTITVSNAGSAATTGTVTVTDTLPAGLTPTAASGTGWATSISGQTVTATRSDALANGNSYAALTVTVSVANNAAASVTNTATVSGGGEANTSNDSASDATTINQLPDLTIAKSHTGNFTQGDSGDTYSITVTNAGSAATSATVTVTDTLPAGLTPTAASGTGWATSISGQTVTATRSDALATSSSYPTLTVTVSVASNAAASVTNTATVSGGGEVNTANDSASDATTINQLPDLTIAKSHTGNFTQGDTGDAYSITVSNTGSAASSGLVTVTDTLPAGLTPTAAAGTGWSTSISGQTVTATRSDALANGNSYPALTVTVNVANNAAASVTNTATVSGGGEVNTSNDSASDATTINQLPDLTIAKSHTGTFAQGDVGDVYTITVSNAGSAATSGTVTVTDALPAGLTPTAASGTGWATSISGQTVTATRSDALANGSGYPALTITVDVANNATSVTNVATVSGGGEVNTTNDSSSDGTTIGATPDLTIAKSHTGNFTQGDTGDTYSITVSNVGSASSSGLVTVTDTLPAGLTPAAASGTGWTTSISGQTVTATRSDALANGGSYPVLTVTVDVANNATNVTNTATVAGGGEVNTANDSASDATTVVQLPDLAIAKSHTGNFSQGDSGDTYTITVSNVGSAASSGLVTVTDTLPAGLTPTASSGTGWATSISGQTVTATRSDALANGSSYPALTVTVNVANNASASVTNTATVSGGGEVNTSNDSASDATTINQLPDLTIAKSHTGNFTQGDTGDAYSITVSNTGSAASSGLVTVTDTLPAGLTPTAAAGTGWTTSISGQTVTATRFDALANGSSYPALTVTVNVANNAAASITNTATVSGGGEVNTSNDSASDATTINQLPDLTIAKSHTGTFAQGDVGDVYTITVSNAGSAATSGTVTVTDALPAGLTPTAASGTGWATSISGQTVTATRSDALANGSSYPALTITVDVANNATSVTNVATVSGGGEVNTTNDSSSDGTTIGATPDLTIAKSHTGNFTQGDTGDTYSITVSNVGSASSSGLVTITDTLPAGLTPTAAAGTGWATSISGQTVTATRSDALANGGSYPALTVTVDVANNAAASVTNTATVSGGGEVNTSNDSASDPTTINPLPDLTISKSHTGTFAQGDVGDVYTITVSNAGSAATSGTVTVTDAVPAGLTPTTASGTGWSTSISGQTVTATRSDALANGSSYPALTVTVDVANNATSVTNVATVSGGGEVNTSNDSSSDGTPIGPTPDLAITKSHTGNFTQGDSGDIYSIDVSNVGSAPSSGLVTVTDTLPAGLTPTAAAGTGWTTSVSGQTVTATRSDALANGGSYPTLTVTVDVANNAAGSVTNTASVSGGGEVNTANDSASDPTTINQLPDLMLTKTHAGNFTRGDAGDTYSITVSNTGFAATSGTVTVTDTVPAGLTPAAAAGTGWAASISGQTVTATRSDALNTGASYPVLSVTVSVANTAASSVVNTATVSGGGEVNTSNDSASDNTTILNPVPVASDDSYNVVFNTPLVVNAAAGVLANDTDPDGEALSVATPGVIATSQGSVALNADGSFTYTPNAGATGIDTFTYQVKDPTAAGNTATVTLTIAMPLADLGVTITADKTSVYLGQQVTFTVRLVNNGPDDATNVVLTDILPAGVTYVSSTTTQGSYNQGTGLWSLGTVPNGGGAVLTITVIWATPGAKTSKVSVSASDQVDVVVANNSSSVNVTGLAAADLSVVKTVDKPNALLGQQVTFTIVVSNAGPSNATGVQVTDLLPTGLGFVSATPSQGSYASDTGIWDIGNVNNGATATLSMVATVQTISSVTNYAQITAVNQFDPNSSNDISSATVIPTVPNLFINKTVDDPTPLPGETVNFTITVTNNGQMDLASLVVQDQLPSGLKFVSATTVQGSYDENTGLWTAGPLQSGATATLVMATIVTGEGSITNVATITTPSMTLLDTLNGTALPPGLTTSTATTKTGTLMNTSCFGASINLARPNRDRLLFTSNVNLGSNFNPNGQAISFALDGLNYSCVLNQRGQSRVGNKLVQLRRDHVSGWIVSLRIINDNLKSIRGIVNETVTDLKSNRVLRVSIGGINFVSKPVTSYTAKANVSGVLSK